MGSKVPATQVMILTVGKYVNETHTHVRTLILVSILSDEKHSLTLTQPIRKNRMAQDRNVAAMSAHKSNLVCSVSHIETSQSKSVFTEFQIKV